MVSVIWFQTSEWALPFSVCWEAQEYQLVSLWLVCSPCTEAPAAPTQGHRYLLLPVTLHIWQHLFLLQICSLSRNWETPKPTAMCHGKHGTVLPFFSTQKTYIIYTNCKIGKKESLCNFYFCAVPCTSKLWHVISGKYTDMSLKRWSNLSFNKANPSTVHLFIEMRYSAKVASNIPMRSNYATSIRFNSALQFTFP